MSPTEKITTAPYGSWKSPITAELVVAGANRCNEIWLDGEDMYWIEGRAAEKGRCVIVRRTSDGTVEDMIEAPFDARSRVHEYGGGACVIDRGRIFFVNAEDQRVYACHPGSEPQPITPEGPFRYAAITADPSHDRLIAVCEDHSDPLSEPANYLVTIDARGASDPVNVISGYNFYSNPTVSPDGKQLAWLCWNHPNMPWDGTELWVASIARDGTIGDLTKVAGGEHESIFQPLFSPDNILHFVSDRSGWWNLYRMNDRDANPICAMEAEFGMPMWVFGMSTYGFISSERLICTYTKDGIWRLAEINLGDRTLHAVQLTDEFTEFEYVQVNGDQVAFLAGSPTKASTIYQMPVDLGELRTIRSTSSADIDDRYIAVAEPVSFPTTDNQSAFAFLYRPTNADFTAPDNDRPPLLLLNHGGPTSATSSTLSLKIQFFTSRGFAVLDVNYGGSTGFGRAYRQRLDGKWGIVDRHDCEQGARWLAEQDLVDPDRMAIRGGSAGGYTTLCALTFGDTFATGASHYGVSDLELLATDTHKFEARYLDRMVGPYPEFKETYKERSPINHVGQLNCPVIFFQGLDDKVVPPNQAETMVAAIKNKGLPVAYIPFEGEGHGFRRGENVKRAIEAEYYFYSRIFKFTPADPIEPVPIANLED